MHATGDTESVRFLRSFCFDCGNEVFLIYEHEIDRIVALFGRRGYVYIFRYI